MALDPQVKAMLAKIGELGLPELHTLTPDEARAMSAQRRAAAGLEMEPVERVEDRTIPGPGGTLGVRVYTPSAGDGHPLVVLFHGGGWVLGDLDSEETTCRGLANRTDAIVMSVGYRLAPEARFPAAAEDCYAATLWAAAHARELGADGARLAVAGTSAGGNLAAAVSLMARDRGGPGISHQVLFSPVVDHDFRTRSYLENAQGYGLTREAMIWFWDRYAPDESERSSPYASPLRSDDLAGLPPATIIVAEYDPLRDEAEAYGERLGAAGVDVQTSRYDGMIHGFNIQVGVYDRARDALDEAGARLRAVFDA